MKPGTCSLVLTMKNKEESQASFAIDTKLHKLQKCAARDSRKEQEQTHPAPIHNNPSAHVIALSLEDVKEQGDAVLCGGDQLPDAVLVWGILSGPAGAGDGPIQLGDETSTGGWTNNITWKEHIDIA